MEGGISRLDCYEDMFKEITRKLYGEDPDHRTSSVQNEFETSVSYKNDEDTGNGTDGSDDGNWTCEEEPLKGTDGSRIAAYHASKATWRCYECGDVMGGGPREAAEHFMELHSSRILADDSRHRHHSPRKDYLQAELKVDDVVTYLERLRERAERAAPPTRRTQETQTLPATLLPMTPTFLLQELPSTPQSQHLHQSTPPPSNSTPSTTATVKRYNCQYCPYGTDRRDLFVRHENIHREEKPFSCYECNKPFNRADHVKKHFARMHRDSTYDVSRIRRPPEPKPISQDPTEVPGPSSNVNGPQQQHVSYQPFTANRGYQIQPTPGTSNGIYQAPTMQNITSGITMPEPNTSRGQRGQNSGCHSKSHTKSSSKNSSERRFTCHYCQWTGVDNWCLKRHLNTHIKPYSCNLCDYKAARSERLSTHLLRVHAKRQCTKCGAICDTDEELQMHQLEAHRMSSTSSASRSTPSINRAATQQQPLHPSVGGRAPPGPPVFPAPAQPISQPSTSAVVQSTSTILGHEMVKSPATATTMAYPTEEEKRSYRRAGGVNGDDDVNHDDVDHAGDDNDNDDVVRNNGNREERNRDFDTCCVCSFKNDRDFESCSDHRCTKSEVTGVFRKQQVHYNAKKNNITIQSRGNKINGMDITLDITYNPGPPEPPKPQPQVQPFINTDIIHTALITRLFGLEKPMYVDMQGGKNRRKQLHPRKVVSYELSDLEDSNNNNDDDDDDDDQHSKNASAMVAVKRRYYSKVKVKKKHVQSGKTSPRFRCILCPRHTAARGIIDEGHKPYHTQASLLLHKLWRHRRRIKPRQKSVSTLISSSLISSITLKAIFVARPNYNYCR